MSRIRHVDVVSELIELCRDLTSTIRQQLVYYRASVYKDETSAQIDGKIDQLRTLCQLFRNDMLMEPIRDYFAAKYMARPAEIPGECSYSSRIASLLGSLEEQLAQIDNSSQKLCQELARSAQEHRQELLSMCRQGSRHWSFFRSL